MILVLTAAMVNSIQFFNSKIFTACDSFINVVLPKVVPSKVAFLNVLVFVVVFFCQPC